VGAAPQALIGTAASDHRVAAPRGAAAHAAPMSIVTLFVVLVVVGVVLWLVNTYVPMQPQIKTIINVLAVLFVVLWLLSVFGVLPALHRIRVG
jgi:ABC-type siderophore export system fused ATPase/permease subunit